MKITKFGHSCLLIEDANARILLDPGSFAQGDEDLTGLHAMLAEVAPDQKHAVLPFRHQVDDVVDLRADLVDDDLRRFELREVIGFATATATADEHDLVAIILGVDRDELAEAGHAESGVLLQVLDRPGIDFAPLVFPVLGGLELTLLALVQHDRHRRGGGCRVIGM